MIEFSMLHHRCDHCGQRTFHWLGCPNQTTTIKGPGGAETPLAPANVTEGRQHVKSYMQP